MCIYISHSETVKDQIYPLMLYHHSFWLANVNPNFVAFSNIPSRFLYSPSWTRWMTTYSIVIYLFIVQGNILHTVPAAVADDPTLARSQQANCANCGHHEAVFFQSDTAQSDSLALIFVCCNCGHKVRRQEPTTTVCMRAHVARFDPPETVYDRTTTHPHYSSVHLGFFLKMRTVGLVPFKRCLSRESACCVCVHSCSTQK